MPGTPAASHASGSWPARCGAQGPGPWTCFGLCLVWAWLTWGRSRAPGNRKDDEEVREEVGGVGRGHRGERQSGTRPRLGFEAGRTPFCLRIPKHGFNEGQLQTPVSAFESQQASVPDWLGPCWSHTTCWLSPAGQRARCYHPTTERACGVQLVAEGADTFKAKVNVEVQLAPELAIAAIERNGVSSRPPSTTGEAWKFCANQSQSFSVGNPFPSGCSPGGARALLHWCEKPRLAGGSRISRSKTGAGQEVRLYFTRRH